MARFLILAMASFLFAMACSGDARSTRALLPGAVSQCGVTYRHDWTPVRAVTVGAAWTAPAQIEAEGHAIAVLARVWPDVCARARGFQVVFVDGARSWFDSYGRHIQGWASCQHRPPTAIVGSGPWRESGLAHELAHLIQGCQTSNYRDPGHDYAHADWARMGIDAALAEFAATP